MYKFFIVSLLTIFVLPSFAFAATLAVTPGTGVYNAGATFTTRIVVNTAGKSINAAEGTVKFNPSELSVVSVDRSSSIFNLWVTEPTFSNSAGTVSFSGGLPSGYTGSSGTVFSITFRTKAAGAPKVSLTGGSVLANDGMGTNVLTNMSGGTYTVQAPSTTPEQEVVIEYVAPANTPAAPIITSTTHEGGDTWSKNKTAKLSWNLPSGIEAVRTLLDSSATAIPTKVYDSPISNIELTDLAEGTSYFHLQFKNADGWGKVTHYRLAVDTEAPGEFVVTTAEGTEAANPIQTLDLKVKDAASGIARFMVRIDNNEAFEYVDKDNTGKLVLPSLAPGYHAVIIEAFDRAGNSVIATHSFTIESFSKPVFTEFPTEINEEVIPVLRGTTRAGAAVEVSINKIGAEPTTYQMTADENGVFTVIPSGTFLSGVYEITARATDTYGAQSELSDPIRIAVQQPGYLQIGSFIVNILSVVIPLLAMTVVLVLFGWFMVIYYRRFKNSVSRESGEVVATLSEEFALLQSSLQTKKEELMHSRKTGRLTKIEETTFTEIEQAINEARLRINKEVDDVEQILHKKSKKQLNMLKKEILFGIVLGVIVVFVASEYVVNKRMKALDRVSSAELNEQIESAVEVSKLLARGAAIGEVEQLIPECNVEQMVAYDSLLSALDKGLSYTDLLKLNELFAVCGSVAAQRRSVMTLILNERVEGIATLVAQKEVAGYDTSVYKLSQWEDLAKKEVAISKLFVSLVDAQESIIVALIKNVPATSITVENIRASAQALREEMITLTEEVTALRASLATS